MSALESAQDRAPVRVAQPGADLSGEALTLSAEAVHYLTVVRRLGANAPILIFDTQGQSRSARLVLPTDMDGWRARFEGPVVQERGRPNITLCYGLPKGEKLDRVVRQVTELGVAHVRLLSCAHSVVRLSGDRAAKRISRLTRIAQEAARQCGRTDVPTIEGPVTPIAAVASPGALRLVLHPEGGAPLIEALCAPVDAVEIFVGPEGGFSPEELAAFDRAGAARVRLLGPVLRTETAAPIACALVLHRLDAL